MYCKTIKVLVVRCNEKRIKKPLEKNIKIILIYKIFKKNKNEKNLNNNEIFIVFIRSSPIYAGNVTKTR